MLFCTGSLLIRSVMEYSFEISTENHMNGSKSQGDQCNLPFPGNINHR